MIKVSVILPIYNVQPYLQQCLDTILNQTLRDIEVICVDDGSTDDSNLIVRELSKKDERLILLEQENKGAGAARNKGMEIAKGKYLSFLDSDDFFELNMLEKAYQRAEEISAQIVCFRSTRYFDIDGRFEECNWTIKKEQMPDKKVFSADEIKSNFYLSMLGWAWDKLFLHNFIKDENLNFQEIMIHNDMYFTYSALISAERITVLEDVLVHQRKRISGSLSNHDVKTTALECIKEALSMTFERLKSSALYKRYEQDFINYSLHVFSHHLGTTQGNAHERLFHLIRDDWIDYFGFEKYNASYFTNEEVYQRYLDVKAFNYEEYLLIEELRNRGYVKDREISNLKKEIATLHSQLEKMSKTNSSHGKEYSEICNSRSYKIGRAITSPIRFFKKHCQNK